jgi:PKD domain
VTIFARPPFATFSAAARRLALALGLAVGCIVPALLTAAPAGAVVTSVGPVRVGLQPRVQPNYLIAGFTKEEAPENYLVGAEPAKYGNPEGNPVLHSTNTWAIYWDGAGNNFYHGDWQHLIDTYFSDAATASGSLASVFAVDGQYTDKSNQPATYKQVFRGGAEDTTPYPASGCTDPDPLPKELLETGRFPGTTCLTTEEVQSHLESYIKLHHLPTGMNNVYYLLTPPSVTVCLDGGGAAGHCSDYQGESKRTVEGESYNDSFCSYHAAINPGGPAGGSASTILYGVIPWTAGEFGYGEYQNAFGESFQGAGWPCQDGGYNPASKPTAEKREKAKEQTKEEKEAFEKKTKEEQAEVILTRELEGPHEQEPNQQLCPTEDGWCDIGLADLIINQIANEQQNIVTDPLLNAWKDPAGYENTDECRFVFDSTLGGSDTAVPATEAGSLFNQELNGGQFYLNDGFNYAGMLLDFPGIPCRNNAPLVPRFTAPSLVNTGEVVSFDGMESFFALNAGINFSAGGAPQSNYAIYTWNFGDGTPVVTGFAPGSPPCESPWLTPCAGSAFHSYEFGGTYEVTLTIRDVAGNTATATQKITVSGPPRPNTSGNAGNTGNPGGNGAHVAGPIVAALIAHQRLHTALRKGLLVDYSVNEQVAGHFEVLISRSLARRLHISGTPATGLPADSPPELVIARAILVTTKGGHNAVHIVFSKRTASRLAHMHKVPLTVRLSVRNAGAGTSTAIASSTLSS